MSAENPPTYNFNGIDFNPGFYTEATTGGSGISQGEADTRYLIKVQPDSTNSIQTFEQGIQTNSGAIEALGGNILTNSGNITTNSGDVISTLGTVRGRFCNISLYATIPTLYSNAIDASASSTALTLGQNQIDGLLNIGNNANRTATINISTGATTTANIVNIGNNTTNNQTLNLNSKTINVGNSSGVSTINISNISNSVHNVNIGNNTANQQGLNINSKYIQIGSETATSTITLNKPLNPVYTFTPNIYAIGGTVINNPGAIACTSGTPVTIATVGNVPFGVYQIFYQIKYTITVASIPFTEQRVGLCNTINAINTPYNQIESLENQPITRPVGAYSITGGGIWVNIVTPALSTAYLNIRNTFTLGTLSADATLRLVRIG
jgi:hypothetical protein